PQSVPYLAPSRHLRCVSGGSWIHSIGQQLREIAYPYSFFQRMCFDGVFKHRHTERTAHGNRFRFRPCKLPEPMLINASSANFLFPEAATPRTATIGAVFRFRGLLEF